VIDGHPSASTGTIIIINDLIRTGGAESKRDTPTALTQSNMSNRERYLSRKTPKAYNGDVKMLYKVFDFRIKLEGWVFSWNLIHGRAHLLYFNFPIFYDINLFRRLDICITQ